MFVMVIEIQPKFEKKGSCISVPTRAALSMSGFFHQFCPMVLFPQVLPPERYEPEIRCSVDTIDVGNCYDAEAVGSFYFRAKNTAKRLCHM